MLQTPLKFNSITPLPRFHHSEGISGHFLHRTHSQTYARVLLQTLSDAPGYNLSINLR